MLVRMRSVTEELYLVRDELYRRAAHRDDGLDKTILAEEALDVIVAFKAAVDELRQFIWHFINQLAVDPRADVNETMRAYQLTRVVQLVKALAGDDSPTSPDGKPVDVVVREIVEAATVKAGSQPRCE